MSQGNPICEPLERRVMLSAVRAAAVTYPHVDAGDVYWGDGQWVPLLRATDQVVLGLLPTSARRAARLVTAITSDSGALRGYSLFQTLTPTNFLLKRSAGLAAPGFRKLERKIGNFPAFKYLAPTFFAAGTSRASVVDQVSVKLLPGVTPEQVFGSEYSGWELVGGRYEAKLARGGALEALKAAAVLHDNPLIKDVDPLFAFDVVPS